MGCKSSTQTRPQRTVTFRRRRPPTVSASRSFFSESEEEDEVALHRFVVSPHAPGSIQPRVDDSNPQSAFGNEPEPSIATTIDDDLTDDACFASKEGSCVEEAFHPGSNIAPERPVRFASEMNFSAFCLLPGSDRAAVLALSSDDVCCFRRECSRPPPVKTLRCHRCELCHACIVHLQMCPCDPRPHTLPDDVTEVQAAESRLRSCEFEFSIAAFNRRCAWIHAETCDMSETAISLQALVCILWRLGLQLDETLSLILLRSVSAALEFLQWTTVDWLSGRSSAIGAADILLRFDRKNAKTVEPCFIVAPDSDFTGFTPLNQPLDVVFAPFADLLRGDPAIILSPSFWVDAFYLGALNDVLSSERIQSALELLSLLARLYQPVFLISPC